MKLSFNSSFFVIVYSATIYEKPLNESIQRLFSVLSYNSP